MTTIILDLPQELYRRAQQAAQVTDRPVEQIIVEWIQPPTDDNRLSADKLLSELENMTIDELVQVARFKSSNLDSERLQSILDLQKRQALTADEQREAEQLVAQEDLYTLRKAKALYLLKQRGVMPRDLAKLIA
jgi:hypothetical protein